MCAERTGKSQVEEGVSASFVRVRTIKEYLTQSRGAAENWSFSAAPRLCVRLPLLSRGRRDLLELGPAGVEGVHLAGGGLEVGGGAGDLVRGARVERGVGEARLQLRLAPLGRGD